MPRDRQARFDPQLIAKYQRRFPGFDDKIISMYARGMSTREIVGHLRDLYGIEVSLRSRSPASPARYSVPLPHQNFLAEIRARIGSRPFTRPFSGSPGPVLQL